MGKLKSLNRPKVLVPAVIVILLAAALILAVRNLNAPAEGTINQTPPDKAEVIEPYTNPGKYSGNYLSFTYPAHYKPVPVQKTGNYLEVAGFYSTDQTSKKISVGVLKENVNDDSGVRLRRLQTDKYQEQPHTATGTLIFTSTANGSEHTAYVPHGGLVAGISFTAPAGWDLSEDLQTILSSLKWK